MSSKWIVFSINFFIGSISLWLCLCGQRVSDLISDVVLQFLELGIAVHDALFDCVLLLVDGLQFLLNLQVNELQLSMLLRDLSLQLTELLHELAICVLLLILC